MPGRPQVQSRLASVYLVIYRANYMAAIATLLRDHGKLNDSSQRFVDGHVD